MTKRKKITVVVATALGVLIPWAAGAGRAHAVSYQPYYHIKCTPWTYWDTSSIYSDRDDYPAGLEIATCLGMDGYQRQGAFYARNTGKHNIILRNISVYTQPMESQYNAYGEKLATCDVAVMHNLIPGSTYSCTTKWATDVLPRPTSSASGSVEYLKCDLPYYQWREAGVSVDEVSNYTGPYKGVYVSDEPGC
ncbi:hypothetical protein AB0M29_13800 [Streptomyces sp. NPDC051976]|uniref:hypothetical protein n=1 Tax=Streptomyces sp. NPDC051976 TaxID=3154947 RepID=UPI003439F9DA